jgi:biopolymer transport protein ExbD
MPPKLLFRLGLAFLLVAAFTYPLSSHWLNSRIFTPLDSPVSLESRQIKSPPFGINLRETYFVSLHLDYSVDDWYEDGRCNYKNLHVSQWRIYRLGSTPGEPRALWANSEDIPRPYYYYEGAFNAASGRYELEVDLPASASCLNPRHPRLMVYTVDEGYREGVALMQICCIFLGGTGVALALLGTFRALRPRPVTGEAPRIFPDMVMRNVLAVRKHKPLLPIQTLPHWGLFFGTLLWILLFIFMISRPLPSRGLFVGWRERDAVVWEKSPWPDTLEVYVGAGARFFINGIEVERSELCTKLLEQLARRAEWTVYFEADNDTLFMDDAYAIDTIQACGAKIVWVTPKMRQEWQHKNPPMKPILVGRD